MLRLQEKKGPVSSGALTAGLFILGVLVVRAVVVWLSINAVLRPWTDTRIDMFAALGMVLLLTEISLSFESSKS